MFLGAHRFAQTRADWKLVWTAGTTRLRWWQALETEPDGILAVVQAEFQETFLSQLGRRKLVVLNTMRGALPMVISDGRAAARRGAGYLLDRRLRNFAYVGWRGMYFAELRREGLVEALRAAGREEEVPSIDFETPLYVPPGLDEWLRALPLPCGVVCANDQIALQIILRGLALGLEIPGDLAVLGISNDEMTCAESPVSISSVEQHFEEVGYRAAQLMDGLLRGERAPRQPVLVPPGEVVERGSTRVLGVDDPLVRAALTIINEPHADPLTMPQLMSRLGQVSQRLLELRFQEVLGRSPYQEILQTRVRHAKRLLRSTRFSLEEIAVQAGFGDPSVFSRHFRKMTGQTASQYRRQSRVR
jgi:LacI family transcriptional regulator